MAFNMKGSSLYGKINLNRGGNANRPDGRAKSSAFQDKQPGEPMKDLSGDGKITQKDVLIGRGVIDKNGSPLKASCWPGYEAKGKKK